MSLRGEIGLNIFVVRRGGDAGMTLKRTRILDGYEVATPEFYNAVRAVNFILRNQTPWAIDPNEKEFSNLEMIEHARQFAYEKGYRLVEKKNLIGWTELNLEKYV